MKKGKIALLFGLAILSVSSIGGSWASWVATERTRNEYMIPQYRTSLYEEFEQPENWQPGVTTKKEVKVTNNMTSEDGTTEEGNVPVMAKVEIDQNWIRRETIYGKNEKGEEIVAAEAGEEVPAVFEDDAGNLQYAAIPGFHKENVVVLSSGKAEAEDLRLGLDYVDLENLDSVKGKWLLVNEQLDVNVTSNQAGKYVLYYLGIIGPAESSPVFLEYVKMNPLLENTITEKKTTYEKQEDGTYKELTVTSTNSKYGYDGCRYTMSIQATTVQATPPAVEKTFSNGFYTDIVYYLIHDVAEPIEADASDLEKKLTILYDDAHKKSLSYVPYRTEDGKEEGNWFMSFTDMIPGGVYKDTLKLENKLRQKLWVYMHIDPIQQEAIKDEVLELISMKVYFKDECIYDGKVTGAEYYDGENLQKVIPLCYMNPGEMQEVKVELMLDPNLECDPITGYCEYANVLSKIDWEFMVQITGGGGGPGGGNPPGGPGKPKDPHSSGPPRDISGSGSFEDPYPTIPFPDPPVPLFGLLPMTGDHRSTVMYGAIALVSFLMLLGLAVTDKKKKKAE